MSELSNQILERIINLLQKKKCKQQDLTNYLSLEKTAFTDWKKGKSISYMSYLGEISEFFGVSVDYIVCGRETALTENETEMLTLFRRLSEHEQAKTIGRIEEMLENKDITFVGRKIARRTDGEAVRTNVTEEELKEMEKLPEETEF